MMIRFLQIAAFTVLLLTVPTAFAQSSLPLEAYGVWTKSSEFNPSNPDYDYLLALTSGSKWKDLQPNSGSHFDWSEMQSALQLAYDRGQMLYLSIGVVPEAPEWVYDQGVPKVTTRNGKDKWPYYPYYLDTDYTTIYHHLVREFGRFLRKQPQHLVDRIAFAIGLFRVAGTIGINSPIYSRFARAFENSSGKNAMFFKLEDGFFTSPANDVNIRVIYYDDVSGSTWQLKYDAGVGNFKTAYTGTCTGSNTWKTETVEIADAVMLHNGPNGADFALVNSDGQDDIFHMIEIEKAEERRDTR